MTQKMARCCSNRQYRLRCVLSKGLLLLMAWTFFWTCGNYFCFFISDNITGRVFNNLAYALYLVFPLLGWIADSWLGRYKVITVSVYVIMLSWVLLAIGYAFSITPKVPLFMTVLSYCGLVILLIGNAGFVSSTLPFVLDQMFGASGEELSAVVHWWYWSVWLSYTFGILIAAATLAFEFFPLVCLLLALACTLFLVVTHLILKGWLVRDTLLTNPIKHIAKVLNYARKNKYPRNRSALTYWEEDYPSRLDLGKDKYGGPFSEEEVEDVKTVLRLLPLLVCMAAFGIIKTDVYWSYHYALLGTSLYYLDVLTSPGNFWSSVIVVVSIPLYQLVVYPCFYRYVPSMLRRMGAGLLLLILAQCCYAILELVGHRMDHSVGCVFTISSESHKHIHRLPIPFAFTMIPQAINGFGQLLLVLTSLEFVVAQTPTYMRALMIGLWYAAYGIASLLGFNLYIPFSHTPSSSFPSCGFYYFLTKVVILILLLLLFLFLSKRYRLREVNIPVNFHLFAENYYDKYIDIERQIEEEERTRKEENFYASCQINN